VTVTAPSARTTYCPPVDRRVKLLGISEDMARADLAACERRIEEARRPGL
jgi:hypothetical protein